MDTPEIDRSSGEGEPVSSFSELQRKREAVAEGAPEKESVNQEINEFIKNSPFADLQARLGYLRDMQEAGLNKEAATELYSLSTELRKRNEEVKDFEFVGIGDELLAQTETELRQSLTRLKTARPESVDQQVEARIASLRAELEKRLENQEGIFQERLERQKQELEQEFKLRARTMVETIRKQRERLKSYSRMKIPEFEGETEEERDNQRVDWIRGKLCKVETKRRSLSRIEWREFQRIVGLVENEEVRERLNSEIHLRQELMGLLQQWESVCGSEKAIGGLIGKTSKWLTVDHLVELSNLQSARKTETERESLSVQVSRAMSLYLGYLGVWAEAFEKLPELATKEEKEKMEKRAEEVAMQAQKKLASLPDSHGAKIGVLEAGGIRAGWLKGILENSQLPEGIKDYKKDFIEKVKGFADEKTISLHEIFGLCMFSQEVSSLDIAWTKHIVASLSGSKSAEIMVLWLLDFTGETDVLNKPWVDGAYRATDYQKLIQIRERRLREAAGDNPFGYEESLGEYPKERKSLGWFENAKIAVDKIYGDQVRDSRGEVKDEFLEEGKPKTVSVKDILRGWELKDKNGNVVATFAPKAFHEIDWNLLPRDTYMLHFLLPNLRYLQTYEACLEEVELKDFNSKNQLRAVNKAFKATWGSKKDFIKKYGRARNREYGVPEWVVHSPWAWYAIGFLSEHSPEGKKLPRMSSKPPLNQRLVYELSAEEKRQKVTKPTYDENFVKPLKGSKFLKEEEMDFVEKYCQISEKGLFGRT